MRMWMVDPVVLCRKHLLGEHGEIHKHRHDFVKGHRIAGRIAGNAVEPLSMESRHDDLALEMKRRGYNHRSPYEQPDLSGYSTLDREYRVDTGVSMALLVERCEDCRKRMKGNV